MRLKANVTLPDMLISSDVLDFGDVICGNCQIITIQIHNHKQVRCEWSALPTEKELREVSSYLLSVAVIAVEENSCSDVIVEIWISDMLSDNLLLNC